MLRLLAEVVSVGVRKDKYAVVAVDDAELSARVAREARMTHGMNVARTHALARLEARRNRHVTAGRHTFRNQRRRLLNSERRGGNAIARSRLAGFELFGRDEACLRQQHKKRRKLPLGVTHAQVFSRRDKLYLVTGNVNVPLAPCAHCAPQREHAPFPALVQRQLVFLFLDSAHILHAAHIVDAVHAETPACGGATLPTPTIESRVTSAASCSSLNCAVPAGRSGKTR